MRNPSTYRRHAHALIVLALPLIGSHLAQFAIHMVDTVMLGWYGVEALAAAVLANGFFFIFFIFGCGFGFALMPLVPAAIARGEDAEVRRVTRMALWWSFAYAVLMVPVMLSAERILLVLGQEPRLAELGGDYLGVAVWGLIPSLGVNVLKTYLSALERAGIVLWATLMAVVLNAVLNYAFIFGNLGAPELGMRGAALASVLVELATFIVVGIVAVRLRPEHALFARFWRADPDALRQVFAIGVPIAVTTVAEVGLFVCVAVLVGWIGTVELAAHGAALQIASLMFMFHLGLSNAATIRMGQALGRSDVRAVWQGAIVTMVIAMMFVVVAIVLFLGLPAPLIGLFLDPASPARDEVIAVGVSLLGLAALFQLADAGQAMTIGLLRGLQDTRVPMWMALFSYWGVGMPTAWVMGFPLGWGVQGIWGGLITGLSCAWILLGWRFWRARSWMDNMGQAPQAPSVV
ncbi:MATE family efflux transporter [Aliiroseovarius sp. PTFE2010]|uniref:MATE family efflux transporter n=1 Tax=Aliiroseovarius sp. PTFE2010 TaxID=3417190 RepID=UPI003CF374C5